MLSGFALKSLDLNPTLESQHILLFRLRKLIYCHQHSPQAFNCGFINEIASLRIFCCTIREVFSIEKNPLEYILKLNEYVCKKY